MKTCIMTTERTLMEQIGEILEDEARLVFPEGLYFAGGDETECLRIACASKRSGSSWRGGATR